MNLLVNAVHLKARYALGFTLIELVITLVIIGVLSALGAGLFASPSAYSSVSARDQLVSSALLAQKMALANTCKTIVFVVDVEESEDEWRFVVRKEGREDRENCEKSEKSVSSTRTAERNSTSLNIDGTPLNNGTRKFTFEASGNLSGGENVNIAFIGASSHYACISSLGFAYPEECPQ